MEPSSVIIRVHVSEKALVLAEKNNIITFIVRRGATKHQIKESVEKLYGVEVEKVNMLISPTGEKKAYVKLSRGFNAVDVLSRLGVL